MAPEESAEPHKADALICHKGGGWVEERVEEGGVEMCGQDVEIMCGQDGEMMLCRHIVLSPCVQHSHVCIV